MTSLAHDHLLEQGSAPTTGATKAPAAARTTTSRRRAAATEGKAETAAATPRPRTAQRSATTRTPGAARTTAATTAAAKRSTKTTAASVAKAAPAKAAPAKTAPAKAAPAKAKAAPAKAAPAKAKSRATDPAPVRRGTAPRPRPAADDRDVVETPTAAVTDDVEPVESVEVADRNRGRWVRRLPGVRRRPALFLAAALVAAVGVSTAVVATEAQADTTPVSESVSVAKELGISGSTPELSPVAAGARLSEMVVSRQQRDGEQAHYARAQSRADKVVEQRRAVAAAAAARPKVVLPVKGARLTSTFGMRWGTLHAGIDLAAPIGTPEYAAMDGVVLEAGPASGFGLAVYIQHANGDVTVYGHMEQILVKAGQVVRAGDTIALLGNRGQSTGPHLHFEVHLGGINGTKTDPLPWLRARGVTI